MFGFGQCRRQTGGAVRDKEVRTEHDKNQVNQALADIPESETPVAHWPYKVMLETQFSKHEYLKRNI